MSAPLVETVDEPSPARETDYCRALEQGRILLFARPPFELPDAERSLLLSQRQTRAGYHKNIAYRPAQDRVTGYARGTGADAPRLRDALRFYSRRATEFAAWLLPRYARTWRLDLASFRPEEEEGRALPARSRNDLIHVDAFPTRPTRGDRILRLFTNINPAEPRVWLSGGTFEEIAPRFAPKALVDRARREGVGDRLRRVARAAGLKVAVRSPYDRFMLSFHHYLKESAAFQAAADKSRVEFPAGATWMVFTDMVSHAVLKGRYALEQTFLVARDSLVLPDKAPIAILERIARAPMS
ncbi:MAG TPA: Kdo hydroxylase family protein [Vicinamibacteria bacterium]